MRTVSLSAAMLASTAASALAQQEAPAAGGGGLMSLQVNLMFWTLIIFVVLFVLLSKFAFPKIIGAVEAREKALEETIEAAKRDREAAAKLLEEHRAQIEAARGDVQRLIAEGRAVSEKMRHDLIEQTRQEQQEMLTRARRDLESEKVKAIAELRREAVDLAIAGASKVVEHNLDSASNRKLVESFLASIGSVKVEQ